MCATMLFFPAGGLPEHKILLGGTLQTSHKSPKSPPVWSKDMKLVWDDQSQLTPGQRPRRRRRPPATLTQVNNLINRTLRLRARKLADEVISHRLVTDYSNRKTHFHSTPPNCQTWTQCSLASINGLRGLGRSSHSKEFTLMVAWDQNETEEGQSGHLRRTNIADKSIRGVYYGISERTGVNTPEGIDAIDSSMSENTKWTVKRSKHHLKGHGNLRTKYLVSVSSRPRWRCLLRRVFVWYKNVFPVSALIRRSSVEHIHAFKRDLYYAFTVHASCKILHTYCLCSFCIPSVVKKPKRFDLFSVFAMTISSVLCGFNVMVP